MTRKQLFIHLFIYYIYSFIFTEKLKITPLQNIDSLFFKKILWKIKKLIREEGRKERKKKERKIYGKMKKKKKKKIREKV